MEADTLLIVEDSHIQAKIICQRFESLTAFHLVTAHSLADAQRLAEEAEMEAELDRGMRALIVGALVLMDEEEFQAKP